MISINNIRHKLRISTVPANRINYAITASIRPIHLIVLTSSFWFKLYLSFGLKHPQLHNFTAVLRFF